MNLIFTVGSPGMLGENSCQATPTNPQAVMIGFGSGYLLLSSLKYNPDRTCTKNQWRNLGEIQENYLLIPFQRENFRKEI